MPDSIPTEPRPIIRAEKERECQKKVVVRDVAVERANPTVEAAAWVWAAAGGGAADVIRAAPEAAAAEGC